MVTWALTIQLTASALTIAGTYFYGNKSTAGPWFGIAAQVPWWIIMTTGGLWGLLPVNGVMLILHIRNLIKWRSKASDARTPDTACVVCGWSGGGIRDEGCLLTTYECPGNRERADARRETVQAQDQRATALQEHHQQRRAAKAYEVLARGELR